MNKAILVILASGLLTRMGIASASDTVFVAANGIDSATCGGSASPCRTITFALALAPTGGSVAVGPGAYGDVNGDGTLSGAEEEPGNGDSAIEIAKPVRLYSTQGAAVTTISGGFFGSVVQIDSNDVVFGGEGAGFTLTASTNAALIVDSVSNVAVIGNVALNNGGRGFLLFSGGVVEAIGNRAIGNAQVGFFANAFSPGQYVVMTRNVATSNSDGFEIAGVYAAHQIFNNVASDNGTGMILLPGPSRISENTFSGNVTGILLDNGSGESSSAGPLVTHNNIVGSRIIGVNVFVDGTSAPPKFSQNNILGTAPGFAQPNVGCGVVNYTPVPFDARNNYWGAPSGPGAKPADTTCQGAVLTSPFATRPFAVQ
jgi:hypothetical protein